MAIFLTAFVMGLIGSFHCIGMCGPLALSLPINSNYFWPKFSGALIYNIGRIITYSFFGLVFGSVGKTVALFGFQQWLSIILGILIIAFIILPKRITAFDGNKFLLTRLSKLREKLGKLLFQKNHSSLFSIGLLNGLLPCGLVYMAVAGATAAGDVFKSIFFMAFFGLGTLPMMWSVAFFGNFVNINIRQKIRKAYPYMMLMMACLLIIRGMGLGIPYLSPKVNAEKKTIYNCCVKPK
ncbi:MAG TPA: sulfite exporter TauE/SafE family protein [Puia sp.]|nr:sulfite exporter TauE/SafE family protein [Puia sp.]